MAHQNPGRRGALVPAIDDATREDLYAVFEMDDDDLDFGEYGYIDNVAMSRGGTAEPEEDQAGSDSSSGWSIPAAGNPIYSVTQQLLRRYPGKDFLHTNDNEPPPPAPGGGASSPGRSTYGVELEFLVAAAVRGEGEPDPHPGETRWLSPELANVEQETDAFFFTVRNRIVRILRQHGIVINRTDEVGVNISDPFSYLKSLEFDDDPNTPGRPPNVNDAKLAYWVPPICDLMGGGDIIESNLKLLVDAFVMEHRLQGVELRRTRPETINDLAQQLLVPRAHALPGHWTDEQAAVLRSRFIEEMAQKTNKAWVEYQTEQEDPLHVPIHEMDTLYKAWSAKTDFSVDAYAITARDYEYPPDWDWGTHPPPKPYKWWGAEVCSPVYDLNSEDCRAKLHVCCGALRDFMRIHKPMRKAGCGLHVHFGQEDGWNLQELKRIATVWAMVEDDMYAMQRKDREGFLYAGKLMGQSNLFAALFGTDSQKAKFAYSLPDGGTLLDIEYDNAMQTQIPIREYTVHPATGQPDTQLKEIVRNIWRFPSIDGLGKALQSSTTTPGVAWRVGGLKRSTDTHDTGTLEFRIMQGTLDAEHISHWITACHTIINFCRMATNQEFYETMRSLLRNVHPFLVFGVPDETLAYYRRHLDTSTVPSGKYWVYPDHDRPLWTEVFMVRGSGDTHIP